MAKGSAFLVTQSLVSTLISALVFAFVARIITQEEMGIIAALTLTAGVAQIVSDLGFSSGLLKFVAEDKARGADYTRVVYGGILTKVLVAGLAAFLCAFFAPQLSQIFLGSSERILLFQLLSLNIFFYSVFATTRSILLGLSKFSEVTALNLVLTITRQSFVLLFLLLGYGLVGLIFGWILGDLSFVVLAGVILLRGKHLRVHFPSEVVPQLRRLVKFSSPLLVTNIVVFLYGWFDRAILLIFVPLTEVAIYNVAYEAFTIMYIIPATISQTLLAYFSGQSSSGTDDQIASGVKVSTRYITLFFTPVALGLMVTANPVLALFAGQQYVSGAQVLAILSLLGGVAGIGAVFSILLLVYNMTFVFLVINIVSMGFGVALSLLLLPLFGVGAMAIVKGSVLIMPVILMMAALKNKGIVQFDKESIGKGWVSALLMALVVGVIVYSYSSRYLLPVYIAIGVVVYAVALRSMKALKKYDMQLIRGLTGGRLSPIIDFLERILIS